MSRHGVLDYTIAEARKYAARAESHLAALPGLPERETLAHIARLVVERDF